MRRALRVAIDVAAELYPHDYRRLGRRFITVATWVGFDLDGRTDIGWSKSLSCRYQLALAGSRSSQRELARTCASGTRTTSPRPRRRFDDDRAQPQAFAECFAIGLEALGREAEDTNAPRHAESLALEKRALKQDAIGAIDRALEELLGAASTPALQGSARVSGRVGVAGPGARAAALPPELGAAAQRDPAGHRAERAPGQSQSRRHFLAEVTRLLDGVTPVNVHYGTVAREQTTAKRVFMLAAQFRKHFDGRTPIRLLIAESDTPFTLLAALYYARLFGVERHVEISPLFETADGLHHGDRVIGELLDNPHFLAYIRAQGRFCIQLGFSDSGRYIGQPAARSRSSGSSCA